MLPPSPHTLEESPCSLLSVLSISRLLWSLSRESTQPFPWLAELPLSFLPRAETAADASSARLSPQSRRSQAGSCGPAPPLFPGHLKHEPAQMAVASVPADPARGSAFPSIAQAWGGDVSISALPAWTLMLSWTGSGWDRVNFLHSSACGAVVWTFDQNNAVNALVS